jgi:hypothetical protein
MSVTNKSLILSVIELNAIKLSVFALFKIYYNVCG